MEIRLTPNEPAISIGKCIPTNTLAIPPINAIIVNMVPVFLNSSWIMKAKAIENMKVAWSEGNDVSEPCDISSFLMCNIKGRG